MKNFDGIKKIKNTGPPLAVGANKRQIVKVISMSRPDNSKVAGDLGLLFNVPFKPAGTRWPNWHLLAKQRVPLLAAVAALFLAFGSGMWFVLDTGRSKADVEQFQASGKTAAVAVLSEPQVLGANTQVSSEALFNTPIQLLKNYLDDVSRPEIIAKRAELIRQYLTKKHSPLVAASETIAQQEHWEYILPIAFAESTLGKNCSDNNCSNIGVKPGAPSWRHYASYSAWVVDFNRLLDKRYKDWTLQQMCGVYVQPCNQNWLLATQQVLDELQQMNTE